MKPTALCMAIISVFAAGSSQANVSASEAQQLGTTLLPWGAEKSGNADGSIPEYSGGMTTPPASYVEGSGKFVDPFADEKPLFSITASNVEKYKDKLTLGTQELLKRYPDYRVDVYPTHRTYPAMSESRARKTISNATDPECRTEGNGLGLSKACRGGIPFPIPQTGYEAMWNHLHREMPAAGAIYNNSTGVVIDAAGNAATPRVMTFHADYSSWQPDSNSDYYNRAISFTSAPARSAGESTMTWYPYRSDETDQRAWSYSTGQRRVRLAPEFAYDTPVATQGGMIYFDEINMFSGRMDRFDFKLIGKQEIYIPYNTFRFNLSTPERALGKQHVNPDVMRWELHRVWVIEATTKEGMRHVAAKRRYYLDEDTWRVHLEDGIDQSGKLFRTLQANAVPNYLTGVGSIDFMSSMMAYDLARGGYYAIGLMGAPNSSYKPLEIVPESSFSPQAVAGKGVR